MPPPCCHLRSSILDPPLHPFQYLRVEDTAIPNALDSPVFGRPRSDIVCFLTMPMIASPQTISSGGCTNSRAETWASSIPTSSCSGSKQGHSHFSARYESRLRRAQRMNYMHSGSLVLREALEISRGLEIETDDTLALQDWLLWRRVLDHGWLARKQAGLYLYRKHRQSMTADWRPWGDGSADYFHRAALAAETVTLFVPLSGRTVPLANDGRFSRSPNLASRSGASDPDGRRPERRFFANRSRLGCQLRLRRCPPSPRNSG